MNMINRFIPLVFILNQHNSCVIYTMYFSAFYQTTQHK